MKMLQMRPAVSLIYDLSHSKLKAILNADRKKGGWLPCYFTFSASCFFQKERVEEERRKRRKKKERKERRKRRKKKEKTREEERQKELSRSNSWKPHMRVYGLPPLFFRGRRSKIGMGKRKRKKEKKKKKK